MLAYAFNSMQICAKALQLFSCKIVSVFLGVNSYRILMSREPKHFSFYPKLSEGMNLKIYYRMKRSSV